MEERANPPTPSVAGVPGASSAAAPIALASANALPAPPERCEGNSRRAHELAGWRCLSAGHSPGPFRQSYTKNFEVDRVTERTVQGSGKSRDCRIAVLVDAKKKTALVARDHEEVEKLGEAREVRGGTPRGSWRCAFDREHGVHRARSGSAGRGSRPDSDEETKRRAYAPIALVALVLLAIVIMSVKKRKKSTKDTADAMAPEAPIFQLDGSTVTPKALLTGDPDAMRAAAIDARAEKDPATAAVVLRAWLHATPVRRDFRNELPSWQLSMTGSEKAVLMLLSLDESVVGLIRRGARRQRCEEDARGRIPYARRCRRLRSTGSTENFSSARKARLQCRRAGSGICESSPRRRSAKRACWRCSLPRRSRRSRKSGERTRKSCRFSSKRSIRRSPRRCSRSSIP